MLNRVVSSLAVLISFAFTAPASAVLIKYDVSYKGVTAKVEQSSDFFQPSQLWLNKFFIKNQSDTPITDFVIWMGSDFVDADFRDQQGPIRAFLASSWYKSVNTAQGVIVSLFPINGNYQAIDTDGSGKTDSIKFTMPTDPIWKQGTKLNNGTLFLGQGVDIFSTFNLTPQVGRDPQNNPLYRISLKSISIPESGSLGLLGVGLASMRAISRLKVRKSVAFRSHASGRAKRPAATVGLVPRYA